MKNYVTAIEEIIDFYHCLHQEDLYAYAVCEYKRAGNNDAKDRTKKILKQMYCQGYFDVKDGIVYGSSGEAFSYHVPTKNERLTLAFRVYLNTFLPENTFTWLRPALPERGEEAILLSGENCISLIVLDSSEAVRILTETDRLKYRAVTDSVCRELVQMQKNTHVIYLIESETSFETIQKKLEASGKKQFVEEAAFAVKDKNTFYWRRIEE